MRLYIFLLSLLATLTALAQPASGYYTSSTLDGKSGRDLELALKAIVYPHMQKDYDDLWTCFTTTDAGPSDSIPSGSSKTDLVYDMYAWMSQFTKFYSDKDHTQTGGFNREHGVPNSWWGGKTGNGVAYTDLHHLTPADGYANQYKSNWPLGEYETGMTLAFPTADKTNTSGYTYARKDSHNHVEGEPCYANASHVWKVSNSDNYGGATSVFEPADEYKGDFARMYFYVVCAYEKELTWSVNYMFTSDSNNLTTIKDWALALLLKWCRQDPVSDKERNRNNAIYSIQNNRNPFIDYPEFVEYIWGDKSSSTDFAIANAVSSYSDEYKGGGGSTTEIACVPTLTSAASFSTASYDVTITNNESGATVYYTTDGTTPTTGSSSFTGTSTTLTISATTTVKAIAVIEGKSNSNVISATYIQTSSIANTAETAYTTEEAIALITAGSSDLSSTEVYIKGTISKVSSYNSTYGSITYWLDDNTFEIYSGLGIGGAKFTAASDLEAGDVVVVKGLLTKYYTTYEMSKNNVLVSRNATSAQTEEANFTWDLSTIDYASASATEVDWTNAAASMTLVKGTSGSNANNVLGGTTSGTTTYDHTRMYKSQVLTITPASGVTISSIVFTCVSNYGDELQGSTWTNATATLSDNAVTVIPADGTSAITCTIGSATRVTGVVVNYTVTSLPGDVDVDGDVDMVDLTLLKSYLIGTNTTTITEQGLKNAELSGDSTINIADLAKLIQLLNQ